MKICPACNKEIPPGREREFDPFCSNRCKLLDLGAWLTEKHRIPAEEIDIENELSEDETRH